MKIAILVNVNKKNSPYKCYGYVFPNINGVAYALKRKGHVVYVIDASSNILLLLAQLRLFSPDLVLLLAEKLTNSGDSQSFFPELLKHLKIPFISSDTYTLEVSLHKNLARNIVSNHGILIPKGKFIQFKKDILLLKNFFKKSDFPVLVKPNSKNDSDGIGLDSIAYNYQGLKKICNKMIEKYPSGILVEKYIHGEDVLVGFWEGVGEEGVLDPVIMKFNNGQNKKIRIFGYEQKNGNIDGRVSKKSKDLISQHLFDTDLKPILIKTAKTCFSALKVEYFSRLDFRITPENKIYFIENNASPTLTNETQLFFVLENKYKLNHSDALDLLIKRFCIKNNINYHKKRSLKDKFIQKIWNKIFSIKSGYGFNSK